MVGMNQGSNRVERSNKICGCRFKFDESMLKGIEFGLQMVGMNQGSNRVERSNKICGCRFRFDESMLRGD